MNSSTAHFQELQTLIESLCEERLTSAEAARLEELVIVDSNAMRYYLDYIYLHGCLYWDAAQAVSEPTIDNAADNATIAIPAASEQKKSVAANNQHSTSRRGLLGVVMSSAVLLLIGWMIQQSVFEQHVPQRIVKTYPNDTITPVTPIIEQKPKSTTPSTELQQPLVALPEQPPRLIKNQRPLSPHSPARLPVRPPVMAERPTARQLTVVEYINDRIATGWKEGEVTPSAIASDAEWLRRVTLDLSGHIPPVEVTEHFLKSANPNKRQEMVDTLLESPDYANHFATIWTNLLIGRSVARDVDRESLGLFLQESFANNRPWDGIVSELVSAEGSASENGATNFLLAHLNNQAVPATAITARLFLGTQVQCTQCHDHPFNNWKQNQFWELNCFFKQTVKVKGSARQQAQLVSRPVGGPTFYENRRGLMKAAYPQFSDVKVDPTAEVNRRDQLAKLMATGDKTLLAEAFVNRLWAHFMGFGFTHPIDDMGPHNAPTHPELLDRLTREFVSSHYDVKQLARWICNSKPYQLTSQFNPANQVDDPETGVTPFFSRVYVKAMTAEQLYDSMLIALNGNSSYIIDRSVMSKDRQQWLQQFVYAFENEENDELVDFHGTIPQALMMMNGDLIQHVMRSQPGSLLNQVASRQKTETQRIRLLYLTVLSRSPSSKELAAVRKLIADHRRAQRAQQPKTLRISLTDDYEDVLWALLNSNEFLLVH